jgi:hypothetical protein
MLLRSIASKSEEELRRDNFSSAVSEGVDELHMVSDDPSGGAVSA